MAKLQGILPVYDTRTKRILGFFELPASKSFEGDETEHNVDYPEAGDSTNTVSVEKIEIDVWAVNNSRRQNDWFMAAVFTDEEIRLGQYKGYPNFKALTQADVPVPGIDWTSASSNGGRGITQLGELLHGLEVDFETEAAEEEPEEEE